VQAEIAIQPMPGGDNTGQKGFIMNTLREAVKHANVAILEQCNRYTLVRANEENGAVHYILFDSAGRYYTDSYSMESIKETITEDF
jgi:hypothetical protein